MWTFKLRAGVTGCLAQAGGRAVRALRVAGQAVGLLGFRSAASRIEVRSMVPLAVPLIVTQLATMSLSVVDVALAGHLGADVLAAVAIGSGVWALGLVAILGLMSAVPSAVAHLAGGRRLALIWPVFRRAVWLGLGAGACVSIIEWFGAPLLIRAFGVTPALAVTSGEFVRAIAAVGPALGLYCACRGLSEGLSMPRPGLVLGLCGPVILAPLGYLLMYGGFGMPGHGAIGCAHATVIVMWLEAVAFVLYLRTGKRYGAVRDRHLERDLDTDRIDVRAGTLAEPAANHAADRQHAVSIGALIRVGLPSSIAWLMEASLFIATSLVVGRLGDAQVAMHQIALNVASVTFMIPQGLSLAISVRVASARGRHDAVGARRAGLVGIGLALRIQLLVAAVLLLWPGAIVAFYTNDLAIVGGAIVLLRLAGLFQLSDAIQVTANGALRGLKDTRIPLAITLFAYWCVGFPVGLYLCLAAGMGAPGMWCGMLSGLSVAAILLLGRFLRASRVTARTADGMVDR